MDSLELFLPYFLDVPSCKSVAKLTNTTNISLQRLLFFVFCLTLTVLKYGSDKHSRSLDVYFVFFLCR